MDKYIGLRATIKSLNNQGCELFTFDARGNPIAWLEVSNENVDLDNESLMLSEVLQKWAPYFLEYGDITYDHYPKRYPQLGPLGYIGKPLGYRVINGRPWVQFKLNKDNPYVEDILTKYKSDPEFVRSLRASLGGNFSYRVPYENNDGATIRRGDASGINLWNELAISFTPVNDTLSGIRAYPPTQTQSFDETMKSLAATGLTDLAAASGGDALANPAKIGEHPLIKEIKRLLASGRLKNRQDVLSYLGKMGLPESVIKRIVPEKENERMSFWDKFRDSLRETQKSIGKQQPASAESAQDEVTIASLAKRYANGDPELESAFGEALTKRAGKARGKELEEIARALYEESGHRESFRGAPSQGKRRRGEETEKSQRRGDEEYWNSVDLLHEDLGLEEVHKSLAEIRDECDSMRKENILFRQAIKTQNDALLGLGGRGEQIAGASRQQTACPGVPAVSECGQTGAAGEYPQSERPGTGGEIPAAA